MTQEQFKNQIEHFVNRYREKLLKADTFDEQMDFRDDILLIKATIARTMRLCLKYPDLAKEYMDNLPKATMD